jgi:glycosidase
MREIVTPEWVKHAVFYQIFPDRFAKSSQLEKPNNLEPWDSEPTAYGYKGGDLLGVIEHLDHIQELGVTAIYFCPIVQSASNHRYHTHDYYRVDPLLGGNEALDALLTECKRRGLRVVLDGVFNHASRGFFQFNDVLENGAVSPWLDWFSFTEHPANAYDLTRPPGYTAWIGKHPLPKFNTDNPQVREYIMRVGEYWMRKGIDGWRLDVPFEIKTPGFWQEFRQRIKAINPKAYIVGEVWWDSREWLQGDQFDGVMNYLFAGAAIAFSAGQRVRRETVEEFSYAAWPAISGVRSTARRIDGRGGAPWPALWRRQHGRAPRRHAAPRARAARWGGTRWIGHSRSFYSKVRIRPCPPQIHISRFLTFASSTRSGARTPRSIRSIRVSLRKKAPFGRRNNICRDSKHWVWISYGSCLFTRSAKRTAKAAWAAHTR